ncbi:hypothetical protein SDRG_02678 [Saprolegnia diclina VS20]|uniref:AB hydrolase-1 domain-containing protein n=1 Tax=Saprolegnia diclina (strain VS20) TaxID=1156394 RepID=T0QPJ2_SAPDV|nr:hypothetical protein SDRG_02678 [Saprolegnia diclina VS20]EQC40019.1 hypothetical protein SDRG_02678 [Saprolegnia diclina VS20]|eukprot:XP_008606493.1 hypothetical protein SDRG_02678 [Saprolegnia diclina VS20]
MGALISQLVFQPPPATYTSCRRYTMLATALHNRIASFYIKNERAKYTLLFAHGNAEDLGMIYEWFREVSRRLQVNVMAFDYTGYGISVGEPSEDACIADIEAAFAYLVDVKKTPPHLILLYGRSLGTGPTTYLAAKQSKLKQPVAGVILQSPLLSIYRVAFQFRFSLPGDMFCNINRAPEIASPITIIHGTRDEVIPFWHGEELFLACNPAWRSKPLWVHDAGHNNIEVFLSAFGDGFFQHLRNFVHLCNEVATIRASEATSSAQEMAASHVQTMLTSI